MCVLKKCCFCFSLRNGMFIIGSIFGLYHILNIWVFLCAIDWGAEQAPWAGVKLAIEVAVLLLCVLLLFATWIKHTCLILLLIHLYMLQVLSFGAYRIKEFSKYGVEFGRVILYFVELALDAYCAIVFYSYYKQLALIAIERESEEPFDEAHTL